MSVHPAVGAKSAGTKKGTAAKIADLNRRIKTLEATPVQVTGVEADITAGSITGSMIAAGTITAGNIAANTITANQIQANTITANLIQANAIVAAHILAGSITADKIQAGSISATHIAAGAIQAGHIAAGAITAIAISANTIQTGHIQVGGLGGTAIANDSITTNHIVANTIQGGDIAAGTITATNIVVGGMDAQTVIAPGSITTNLIGANQIGTSNIAAGAVTAGKISVSNLQAVSGSMGTITGGIFQTNTSGARIMMGTSLPNGGNGILGVDASNNVTLFANAATGDVTLKGQLTQGSTGLGNIGGATTNAALYAAGDNKFVNGDFRTSSIAEWINATGVTLAYDSAQGLVGPLGSLKITVSSGGLCYFSSAYFTAVPGNPYSSSFFLRTAGTIGRSVSLIMRFYNSSLVQVGSDVTVTQTTIPGQWMKFVCNNAIAPAGSSYVLFWVTLSGTAAGEIYHLDNATMEPRPAAAGAVILADSITATEIQAGSITATELFVTSLSSISANMGTLTAGTITGATVQTATSGARVVLNTAGLTGYNASNAVILNIPVTGTALFDGKINAKGIDLPWNSGGPSQITWWNSTFIQARIESYVIGDSTNPLSLPYLSLVSYRTGYWQAGIQIAAETNTSGEMSNFRITQGGNFTERGSKSTQLMDTSGNMNLYNDLVAGGWIYSGTSSGRFVGRQTGYSNCEWYNSNGVWTTGSSAYFAGAITAGGFITGSLVGSLIVPGTNSLAFNRGSGYMDEDWGIRFNNGGSSQTVYGGHSAAHVVLNGSPGGASYAAGKCFAASHELVSDRRTKTNIRDVFADTAAAMARVRYLRPRKFDRQLAGGTGYDDVGFIAQEVEEIDPELVRTITMPDGGPSMSAIKTLGDSMQFVALLTAALQDADKRIAALEAQLA